MAGRDYILCRDCGGKLICDGSYNVLSRLEDYYGDPSASDWTVELVCPPCLKKIEDQPAEPGFAISPSSELKFVISFERIKWNDAMAWADGLGMRLATVDEMKAMSLPSKLYWSGTGYSQSNAWFLNSFNGYQDNVGKTSTLFAVAVQAEPVVEPLANAVRGECRLWDSQWTNIVNHANCYRDWSKEDAINHAVKMTETYMAWNVWRNHFPPAKQAEPMKGESK